MKILKNFSIFHRIFVKNVRFYQSYEAADIVCAFQESITICLRFIGNRGTMTFMEKQHLTSLDEYFCAQYSDYVRLSALEGYVMPEVMVVGADGNIQRKDSEVMRLCHQKNPQELLSVLKAGLTDTEFTFNFSFRSSRDRTRDPFRKYTFAKLLPGALSRAGETAESAGAKLNIAPKYWQKIVKGKLYPEKNTVIALALVTGMKKADVSNLLNVMGFSFNKESVRDVVCEYLLTNGIFNAQMRDECLDEYKITTLPIKRENTAQSEQE